MGQESWREVEVIVKELQEVPTGCVLHVVFPCKTALFCPKKTPRPT